MLAKAILLLSGAVCSCSLVTSLDELRATDAGADVTIASAPTFVQQNANDFGGTASASIAFTAAVKPHDTIVVCVTFDSSSTFGTLAVTDTLGDAFHLDVGPTDSGDRHYIFSANDVAGGSPQIDLTVSGPPPVGALAVNILEYSGIGSLADSMSAGGTTADISSGARQVAKTNALVLGYLANDNAPVNPDLAFNSRSKFEYAVVEDRLVTTPGPYAATGTTDAGTNWVALMAVYVP